MTMTKRASKALEASIVVWNGKRIEDNPFGIDLGVTGCPLCREYHSFYHPTKPICKGCPIRAKTGLVGCQKTPHLKAIDALDDWRYGNGTKRKFRNAARKQIKFMEGLRDE